MVDFLNTRGGQEFAAHIKQIALSLTRDENKKEKLACQIYAQLVVNEFDKTDMLSYDDLKLKAKEAADAYFKD